jgi:hypothetical protein
MNYLRWSVNRLFITFFLLPLLFLLAAFNASAANLTVAWDPNSESDLAGYNFFYGTTSGNYTFSKDVGNTTSYIVTNLVVGETYYFAVKAYDTSNNESDYSKELVYTLPVPNSTPNTPATPTGPSNGYVQTIYSYDTSGSDPDGDLLTYRFDWGDGDISGWGGAYSRTHTFSSVGPYCVKAQSQDTQGASSAWSACLNVNIDVQKHTISASAGLNGSISPSGSVTVDNGADQSFSINPNQNYRVADVVVNGSSIGAVTSYTFNNVVGDHSVVASFVMGNQPPVSKAGVDQTVRVFDTVQLDGSSSSDVDGDSLTYNWSFVSKPSGSNTPLSNTNAMKPTFVVDLAGTYTLQLVVNDGTVNSAPDTVTISTGNSAPVSNAGADQAVLVNVTVQLDGSSSSDVDGDSLTFNWTLVSKPGGSNATLSNTQAVKPTFVVDVAGTFTMQLIVNDGTVNSAPDTVIVTTKNSAPVSRAGADQSVLVNDTVQLDGSASSDVDGDSLTFTWSFISRPGGSNATLSNTKAMKPALDVDVAGTYTVRLIVNDGTVNSAPDTVTISTGNSASVSNAGADQTVLVNDTVQLDGSASSDVDGDSLSFTWSFISRPGSSNATLSDTQAVKPVFDVDVAGTYTVRLIVNDGTVNSAPDTVTISTENSAPVSHAGADQAILVNDTVQLDGSGSSDVDGDTLTFQWAFIFRPGGSTASLSTATAVKPTFDVDVAGTYTVQLIVNDGTENSVPDTVTISTDNSVPVANAGADQAVLVNDTVRLDGNASSDVDGDAITFKWSFVSRPGGSNAMLSNTTATQPTFVIDAAGTYTIQLIVNDGTINSAPDTVSISTNNSAPVSDAGADQVARINDTVQLDGDGSSDADGDTLTFKWSVIARPGGSNEKLSSTTARKPTFSVDAAGTYTVQLIVNDGTDNSTPDTVTIITENSAPVSDAGNDQTVEEGDPVTLNGLKSTDPDDNIASYSWKQTGGTSVSLSNSNGVETSFTAPNVATDSETMTFQLTIQDTDGMQDVDSCVITVNRIAVVDSDGDGVPDSQDAFPYDPNESLDTDADGYGNNTDTDDDNDGMPDTWELEYGLNPLKDDANDDPDGDEVSNINEYNLGTQPDYYEGNFKPETPVMLSPENTAIVSLTPSLETGDFSDPNINDVHSKTQWKIKRAYDNSHVFDVTSAVALTSMAIPRQILEDDTEYIWQVRFIDNHDTESDWSEERDFITGFAGNDTDGNGVPDDQEVIDNLDLDEDGTTDNAQSDIKCVSVKDGTAQICISIRDAENAVSIVSLEVEDPNDPQLVSQTKGKPSFFEFGMLDFKLLVSAPGDETTVTIYLSKPAYKKGNCFKYDPVNDAWLIYSDYTKFSPNRKEVYLTLTDGGFGDADGIENGIIVDPLAFGSETDPSSDSSGSPIDEILDGIIPNDLSCFVSVAAGNPATNQPVSVWHQARKLEFWLILMLPFLLYLFKTLVSWILTMENRTKSLPEPSNSQTKFSV